VTCSRRLTNQIIGSNTRPAKEKDLICLVPWDLKCGKSLVSSIANSECRLSFYSDRSAR